MNGSLPRWNLNVSYWLKLAAAAVLVTVFTWFPGAAFAQADSGYAATVTASSLIVREKPEAKGNALGSLPKGTKIEVKREDKFGWAEISYNSQTGWVAAYYLVKSPAGAAPGGIEGEPQDTTAGTQSPPAGTPAGAEGTAVESPEVSAPEEPAAADEAEAAETDGKEAVENKAGVVNANGLRLRQEPDLTSRIITLLAESDVLTVQEHSGEWLKVTTADGESGWVATEYVDLEAEKAAVDLPEENQPPARTEGSGTGLVNKRIVIDPGHGGKDGGTTGVRHGTLEKDLNLELSLLVSEKLRANGAEVILTRDTDIFIELADRVAMTEPFGADIFLSLHHNAGKSDSSGIISFYFSETKDKPLANYLQKELIWSTGMTDGGARYGNYAVLRNNPVPSLLLELGFLSNPLEEERITAAEYQDTVADAILTGLQAYFE